MNWREDFEEGFRTGEDNERSFGLVMLTIIAAILVLAGIIIMISTPVAL